MDGRGREKNGVCEVLPISNSQSAFCAVRPSIFYMATSNPNTQGRFPGRFGLSVMGVSFLLLSLKRVGFPGEVFCFR